MTKHKAGGITAVAMERGSPYRAMYCIQAPVLGAGADEVSGTRADEVGWKVATWRVVGWAAKDHIVWPLRVEDRTGRGVLVGSPTDPLRDGLLGVFVAGIRDEELGDAIDAKIADLTRGAMKTGEEPDDAKEG